MDMPIRFSQSVSVLFGLGAVLVGALATGCTQRSHGTVAVVPATYDETAWKYRGRPGTRLDTEHYRIYTTLTEPRLISWLPQTMETALRFYQTLVPASRTPSEPMPVFLFAKREEFEDFTKRTFPARAEILTQVRGGGFMENGITVIQYVSHPTTFPVMTHEGFHQYLHQYAAPDVPAWLNEGLAVLCEGQRWGNDGLTEFDKWHSPTRRNQLAEALLTEDLIDLPQLLRMNAGNVVGGPQRQIHAYYGQVWALMLFLQEGEGGKYAADFERLLATIGKQDLKMHARAAHVSEGARRFSFGRELFRAFFGDDLKKIEQEYVTFMRQRVLNEKSVAMPG
jgi:hypothetical protein